MGAFFSRGHSIYKRIASKTGKKGWLPEGFSLFGKTPGDTGEIVPGGADAELLYKTPAEEISNAAFEKFMKLLKEAHEGKAGKNSKEIAAFLGENHILKIIDRAGEEIFYEDRGIDLLKLLDTAFDWATGSTDVNLVKLGLSLMGILSVSDREDCRDAIIELGKYEEFTFYSLYAVSGWEDAYDIALAYAGNLKGWGGVHAKNWIQSGLIAKPRP